MQYKDILWASEYFVFVLLFFPFFPVFFCFFCLESSSKVKNLWAASRMLVFLMWETNVC